MALKLSTLNVTERERERGGGEHVHTPSTQFNKLSPRSTQAGAQLCTAEPPSISDRRALGLYDISI